MAAEFYATTEIRHGKLIREGDDPTVRGTTKETVFQPGDKVTGLSTDEMKQLWNSGALEQRGSDDEEPASSEQTSSPSGASGTSKTTPSSPAKSEK